MIENIKDFWNKNYTDYHERYSISVEPLFDSVIIQMTDKEHDHHISCSNKHFYNKKILDDQDLIEHCLSNLINKLKTLGEARKVIRFMIESSNYNSDVYFLVRCDIIDELMYFQDVIIGHPNFIFLDDVGRYIWRLDGKKIFITQSSRNNEKVVCFPMKNVLVYS